MIHVNASPSISVALSPACLGGSITITASGANTYTYLGTSTNPLTIPSPTAAGGYNFVLAGSATNGCISAGLVNFTVSANPTVAVSTSTTNACTNTTITLTGSGASTYSWSGAATSTNNPLSVATGSAATVKHFTLIGMDATTGCTASVAFNQNVVVCNTSTSTVGLPTINGYEETSIFPNPFSNEINVNVLDGNVIVYNALGQVVINVTVHSSETINTSDLPKGAYLVKAFNSNGEMVKTLKLVKN
jgi:hypothetical protein